MPGMDEPWLNQLAGQFIVFDGPDGCGKSTQLQRLADHLTRQGVTVRTVRDPGGTVIGEQIRQVLLNPTHDEMDTRCEMLLYMASRAQLMKERITPALQAGQCVLADRFISSTLAYQGAAGGIDPRQIRSAGETALSGRWPDLVVIFDIDEIAAAKRLMGHDCGHAKYLHIDEPSLFSDRMEIKGLEYQARVRQGFLDQAQADPRHYLVVDASPDEATVFAALCEQLRHRLSPS